LDLIWSFCLVIDRELDIDGALREFFLIVLGKIPLNVLVSFFEFQQFQRKVNPSDFPEYLKSSISMGEICRNLCILYNSHQY
jgi:hypothetical protein